MGAGERAGRDAGGSPGVGLCGEGCTHGMVVPKGLHGDGEMLLTESDSFSSSWLQFWLFWCWFSASGSKSRSKLALPISRSVLEMLQTMPSQQDTFLEKNLLEQ